MNKLAGKVGYGVPEVESLAVPYDEDSVRMYRHEINAIPLLDGRAEEFALGQTMAAGREAEATRLTSGTELSPEMAEGLDEMIEAGRQARQRFITANLRLTHMLARKYLWSGLPINDLMQEGSIGLMRAVEKF